MARRGWSPAAVVRSVLFVSVMDLQHRPLSDAEQVALAAIAGAFTGFVIWLYYVVFQFALYVLH